MLATFSARVTEFTAAPVVSFPTNSAFGQVFNPTWVAGPTPGLLMRTQNCTPQLDKCAHCSGTGSAASILTYAALLGGGDASGTTPAFAAVNASSVVFGPHDATDDRGTEDPRMVYEPSSKLYYMYYTCFNSGKTA